MEQNDASKPRGPCPPGDPDAKAVDRILDGHESADELDAKYRSGLLEHAASSLRDRDRAQVVVQDTFVDVFNRIRRFKGGSTFFTWVYSIYKCRLATEHKRVTVTAGREVEFESDASDRSEDIAEQEAAQPQEADWITQLEQALTVSRQHTPEGDHEQRGSLVEVVGDIRRHLPPQTRDVFLMLLAGLSVSEIAHELGSTEANVRGHLMRGREVLKEKRDQRGQRD